MDTAAAPRSAYAFGRARTAVIFAGLMLGVLLSAVNQLMVVTALPEIVDDLGGLSQYSWVLSSYLLAATVTIPLYGKLSDLYGRRPLFVFGATLFVVGSLICSAAPSFSVLLAGRVIQGLGSGGLIPLALAIVSDLVAPRERGKWQGLIGIVFAVSSLAGPPLGGWIAATTSWRWIFLLSVPLGLLTVVVVWLGFTLPRPQRRVSIDYLGAALLVLSTSAGLLASAMGGVEHPWSSPEIVTLFGLSIILLVLFVLWEMRVEEPILSLSLFRTRTFSFLQVAIVAVEGTRLAAMLLLPLFVQLVLGRDALAAGGVLAPLVLTLTLTSILVGQVVARTGRYKGMLLAGPLLMAVGFAMLARLDTVWTMRDLILPMLVLGIGFGPCMQTYMIVVQNAVDPRDTGMAISVSQFFRAAGGVVGVAAAGALLTRRLGDELQARVPAGSADLSMASLRDGLGTSASEVARALPDALAASIGFVFWLAATASVIAFVATLAIERTELRSTVTSTGASEPQATKA